MKSWIDEDSIVADRDSESIVTQYMKKVSESSNHQAWERTGNGHVRFRAVQEYGIDLQAQRYLESYGRLNDRAC